jgi:hypothetical protein
MDKTFQGTCRRKLFHRDSGEGFYAPPSIVTYRTRHWECRRERVPVTETIGDSMLAEDGYQLPRLAYHEDVYWDRYRHIVTLDLWLAVLQFSWLGPWRRAERGAGDARM